jgi:hypothetical protein
MNRIQNSDPRSVAGGADRGSASYIVCGDVESGSHTAVDRHARRPHHLASLLNHDPKHRPHILAVLGGDGLILKHFQDLAKGRLV